MDTSERAVGAQKAPGTPADGLLIAACWSCHGPVAGEILFCATCGAVQPPGQADHFTRLGLSPSFAVDPVQVDRAYFVRQRLLHPDRFATRTPRERALSQQQATALNEAYETIKDPLRRADYLLHLRRDSVTPEGCHLVHDPALLTEALELREALADAGNVEEVAALARRVGEDVRDCHADLADAFAADDAERASLLATRLKYLRKLAEDCRARRTGLAGRG